MLDDFFTRALIAGVGVAIVAGPLGCFVIWRRLAYLGDTLAHAALLGVALSFLLNINITLAVFGLSVVVSLALVAMQYRSELPSDALLGMLSHSALAIGLVALALMDGVNFDVTALLFGDILAVSHRDLALIGTGAALVLAGVFLIWRRLFAATVDPQLAAAEGMRPERSNLIFMLLMATTIAISIKIVGVLLITALLIIPAAAARRISTSPEQMAVLASLIGVLSIFGGLFGSLRWDTPSGPSIVVAATAIFVLAMSPIGAVFRGGIHTKRVKNDV